MSAPARGGKSLPLFRRGKADEDVLEALDFYLEQSPVAAEGFIDALERAFTQIRRAPATGSPRWGHELNLPGLRSWACTKYPYLVFYVPLAERIEIWRVLHMSRDIPRWLQEGAEG